jgi:hypothetical protein
MTFDPKAHLIQLPRRVKDPVTGHFTTRQDEYLEVKWRLVWFREKFPHGSIITETVLLDWDKGVCIHWAHVGDGEGGMATGTGTEIRKSFEDFVETSETRGVGRALAALGIGTQFVGAELDELPHVADAPVTPLDALGAAYETPGMSPPLPVGEDGTPGAATPPHPTAEDITPLVNSARAANVDLKAFGHDMRRLMQLPESQKITKKFLREQMTMDQYNKARAHYGAELRQIIEENVPTHEPPTETRDANASEAVPEATAEGTPAVPSGADSSSVPGPAPDAAREMLRQEALSWYIQPVEIEHILSHHPLEKARNLLWKARRNTPPPTWIPVAAD